MPLAPGIRIEVYEIRSLIGAGGMGEVYRATDPRLKRDVAIKVLPPAFAQDADRLRRFEFEAQAAGRLNHPNVLAIYDIGIHDGSPYLVSELLEGESLRERLRGGKLAPQRAIDYARQVAAGLAAAHAAGIVHRDLKPENLFITKDGRVKILDFGLAKQTGAAAITENDQTRTAVGTVVGTAPYMSPEQIRGQQVDQRSDLFSFGCVLYEMLTGELPFEGASQADTMSAILCRERPELELQAGLTPALDRLVGHCLEKDPEARFQTARDLAFDLDSISGTSHAVAAPDIAPRRWKRLAAAGALIAAALASAVFLGRSSVHRSEPSFQRLTFRRGSIGTARFAPDNQTIVYDAAWEDEPPQIFTVRGESPESRSLAFQGAALHGVSRSGELALSVKPTISASSPWALTGVLAWAPFSGGLPRPVEDHVTAADWTTDGSQMALVRDTIDSFRLEYPPGTVLYKTAGYIGCPRISRSGEYVAFLDHPLPVDNAGFVAVADRSGHIKRLTRQFSLLTGLAWASQGNEMWFSGAEAGGRGEIWAVTLDGRCRLVLRESATLQLHDFAADGRVLIAKGEWRTSMMFRGPSDSHERELSWLDWSLASDISADGSMLVFSESGEGARQGETLYLRETNGAPALKLGRGAFGRFSSDGKHVISADPDGSEIAIYPTGPGQVRHIRPKGFTIVQAGMLADGQHLWFQGNQSSSSSTGIYVSNIDGGAPRLLLAGARPTYPCLTPDGAHLIASVAGATVLVPFDGGKPKPVPASFAEDERIASWAPDNRSFLTYRRMDLPLKVSRVDVATGRRELVREIGPADRAGLGHGLNLLMTPDGKSYVYSAMRVLDELHLVSGLKYSHRVAPLFVREGPRNERGGRGWFGVNPELGT